MRSLNQRTELSKSSFNWQNDKYFLFKSDVLFSIKAAIKRVLWFWTEKRYLLEVGDRDSLRQTWKMIWKASFFLFLIMLVTHYTCRFWRAYYMYSFWILSQLFVCWLCSRGLQISPFCLLIDLYIRLWCSSRENSSY